MFNNVRPDVFAFNRPAGVQAFAAGLCTSSAVIHAVLGTFCFTGLTDFFTLS